MTPKTRSRARGPRGSGGVSLNRREDADGPPSLSCPPPPWAGDPFGLSARSLQGRLGERGRDPTDLHTALSSPRKRRHASTTRAACSSNPQRVGVGGWVGVDGRARSAIARRRCCALRTDASRRTLSRRQREGRSGRKARRASRRAPLTHRSQVRLKLLVRLGVLLQALHLRRGLRRADVRH